VSYKPRSLFSLIEDIDGTLTQGGLGNRLMDATTLPDEARLTSLSRRYTVCITMRLEWDSRKNRINQVKHGGVALETAALVFDDTNAIFRKDRIVAGEQRWHAIGAVQGAVLLVVHVYRMEDEIWRRRNHPHHLGPRS
jgi:uncharacterized DUF497 family protein